MSEKKAKKAQWPIHKMGKRCGYEEFEDGSIRIAPVHADRLLEAQRRQEELDEFLGSIARVSQKMTAQITEARREFWRAVTEDYGLDESTEYLCNSVTRMLTKKPK